MDSRGTIGGSIESRGCSHGLAPALPTETLHSYLKSKVKARTVLYNKLRVTELLPHQGVHTHGGWEFSKAEEKVCYRWQEGRRERVVQVKWVSQHCEVQELKCFAM